MRIDSIPYVGHQTDRVAHCYHPESQFTSSQCLHSVQFVISMAQQRKIQFRVIWRKHSFFLILSIFAVILRGSLHFPCQTVRIDTHYF